MLPASPPRNCSAPEQQQQRTKLRFGSVNGSVNVQVVEDCVRFGEIYIGNNELSKWLSSIYHFARGYTQHGERTQC